MYPLFVTMALGVGVCVFRLGHAMTHPDITVRKGPRADDDRMIHSSTEYGGNYRDHAVRRFLRGISPQIFPGLNESLAGKSMMDEASPYRK